MSVDPNNRPIRVINDDTTEQEFAAGLRIPNADPPKNEKPAAATATAMARRASAR